MANNEEPLTTQLWKAAEYKHVVLCLVFPLYKFKYLGLIPILLFMSVACRAVPSDAGKNSEGNNVSVVEGTNFDYLIKKGNTQIDENTLSVSGAGNEFEIRTDNCGSSVSAEETFGRSRNFSVEVNVDISQEVSAKIDGGVILVEGEIAGAVAVSYGLILGASETVDTTRKIITPADTISIVTLQWEEIWDVGSVTVKEEDETVIGDVPYRILTTLRLSQKGIQEIPCSGTSPKGTPTITPYVPPPTTTPHIPTPTTTPRVPTPTTIVQIVSDAETVLSGNPRNWMPDTSRIPGELELDTQGETSNETVAEYYSDPVEIFNLFESWGRQNGYWRIYYNDNCDQNEFSGAALQIVLYETEQGANEALAWLVNDNSSNEEIYVPDRSAGDTGYIVYYDTEERCNNHHGVRVIFRRYNVVASVNIEGPIDGKSNDDLYDTASWLAQLVDLKLVAAK